MPNDVYRAQNISEYLEHVKKIQKQWFEEDDLWGPWFRGHREAAWKLAPKLYRGELGSFKAIVRDEIEDEIREEFISRAPILFEQRPTDEWEWYFIMQHFGAPTRLLDWTDGALLGLFFAVKETTGEHDAAIWVLQPWKLNRIAMRINRDEVISPCACGVTDKDKKRVARWLPKQFTRKLSSLPKQPIAVLPPHIERRISCQRSCFTVHGSDPDSLHKLRHEKYDCLAKIVIPSFKTEAIRNDLYIAGIDDVTIFPDLEGLGRAVSKRWRPEQPKVPHRHVYTRLRPSRINKDEIGIFAIVKIRKGKDIFPGDNEELVWIHKDNLPNKPKEIRKLYDDFPIIKDDRYGCPSTFNRLTMSWYINHSDKPNVRCDNNYKFFALRDIKPGEELTVDYSTYNDREALKYVKGTKK